MHIRRVNYQVAVWKEAHIAKPFIPTPSPEHGWILEDGELHPLWIQGNDFVPPQTIDILVDSITTEESQDSREDADIDTDNSLWEIPMYYDEEEGDGN